MTDDKQPMQADGDDKGGGLPNDREGGGQSGGGAYKQDDTETGDNRERDRPVKTGRKPD